MEKRTIFAALAAVQTDLAQVGISKDQRNTHGKYNFRGIDDVLNTLGPILSARGVLIMPSVTNTEVTSCMTSGNKPATRALVTVDYHLMDVNGDSIIQSSVGEAMDTSDKAVNKAMTAAFKYFLFQAFCIPVQGTEDADAEDHQVAVAVLDKQEQQKLFDLASQLDEPEKFFKWLKIPLAEVEASRYPQLYSMLEKKVAREYEAAAKAAGQADMIGEEIPDGQ